jgi:hypothetical protein
MTEHVNLKDLESRPRRYWSVDGLPELAMGVVWIVWGLAMIGGDLLGSRGLGAVFKTAIPAVLVLSGFAANWAVRKVKERVTYPRTGYVELPEPTRASRAFAALIALAAASAVAALVLTGRPDAAQKASPIVGVVVSLGLLVASVRQRAPHLLALAGVALALGIAFGMMKMGLESLDWLLVWLGLAGVVVGGLRLLAYLKAHPAEVR